MRTLLKQFMTHNKGDTIKSAMRTLMDRFAKDEQAIRADLEDLDDPVVTRLHESLLASLEGIKPEWQYNNWKRFGEFGLWVMAQDTAYKDIFRWMLNDILEDAEELREELDPKEPKMWYVNLNEEFG